MNETAQDAKNILEEVFNKSMKQKYSGLDSLIQQNQDAASYYASLPDYVKSSISQRSSHINSIESLRDYAENLLRGDD
jgi:hypothetical protein